MPKTFLKSHGDISIAEKMELYAVVSGTEDKPMIHVYDKDNIVRAVLFPNCGDTWMQMEIFTSINFDFHWMSAEENGDGKPSLECYEVDEYQDDWSGERFSETNTNNEYIIPVTIKG